MLEVVFHRDSQNRLSSIFASGHAEFAGYGDDVVCAAVSAILQAARLGLERHCAIALEARQKSGEFSIAWPDATRDDPAVRAIVATAELSVEQIAANYPQHVRMVRKSDRPT
jgi:uncharacterized protein YsxB (DUF464 family)